MHDVTAREVLMIALRGIGVLSALMVAGTLSSLLLAIDRQMIAWGLVQTIFHAAVAVALFVYPDRLAAKLGRRLGSRLSAFAFAIDGIAVFLEFTPFLVNNLEILMRFGIEGQPFARDLGAQSDPITIAIQIVAILIGLSMVVFAKNFAEWTDWDWWRQRAFEDAQR